MSIHVYSTIVSLQKLKTTQSLLSKIAKFTSVPMGNAPTSSNGRLWFCIHPLDFRGRRGLIPVHINIVAKNSLARPNIDKWQKCSTLTFQNSQPNHLQLRAIDKAHAIARVDLQDPPGPQDNYDILWLHRGIWWDWALWAHLDVPARNCAIHGHYMALLYQTNSEEPKVNHG